MTTSATLPKPADDEADTRAVAQPSMFVRWIRTNGAWVLLLDIALIIAFTALSDNQVFWSLQNFQALSLGGTEALLLTLGLAMLLGAGIFDLSLGANLVLSSVVGAHVMQKIAGASPDAGGHYKDLGLAVTLGFLACIATGMAFGLVNGLIIAYLDVNSLIATLGTLGVGTGVAFIITDGGDIGGLPATLQTGFGRKVVFDIPVPTLVAAILAVVLWAVLRYLRFGLHTLAIGSSRISAARAGVKVQRHLVGLTVLAGSFAGLAGFVDIARYASTTVSGHTQDGLAAFTAAVIGGTVLEGGRVNILGAVWGSVLAIVLQTGLIVVGVAPYYQLIVIGGVLVAAVAVDRYRYRRRAR